MNNMKKRACGRRGKCIILLASLLVMTLVICGCTVDDLGTSSSAGRGEYKDSGYVSDGWTDEENGEVNSSVNGGTVSETGRSGGADTGDSHDASGSNTGSASGSVSINADSVPLTQKDADAAGMLSNYLSLNGAQGTSSSGGNNVTVKFLDVGQGDSIFIDNGTFEVLIDASTSDYGASIVNKIKPDVDGDLDLVIATHPDSDHIGGMPVIFKSFNVVQVIDSGCLSSSSSFSNYISERDFEGCSVMSDDNMTLDLGNGAKLKVIETGDDWTGTNDMSVVCELIYGKTKVLFTGDIEEDAERDNLSLFEDIDVLKVAHHGSSGSTCTKFLSKVQPEYAVVSAGKDNSYGHPSSAALSRLSSAGCRTLGTFKDGDITLTITDSGYSFDKSNFLTSSDAGAHSRSSSGSAAASGADNDKTRYVCNKNSMKFHDPSCSSVEKMKESNKLYIYGRETAISRGYSPCGSCNP